jgi:excisionase family DNA binding protein
MTAAANDQQAVFTVTELAKRWRCTRKTIITLVEAGSIATFKLGLRTRRVTLAEVQRIETAGLGEVLARAAAAAAKESA